MRLFALMLLLQQPANATNRIWTNTGTDFNNGLSWGGTAPGSGDVAVFSLAAIMQPNLSASLTIQELNFSTTSSSGYDLTSSSTSIKLTLTNTGTGATSAINAANTSGTNTVDAPIILGATGGSTQTFTQASGGTLVVNGVISSTNTVTLSLTGGIIQLTGTNTYAGATTATAGILNIQNAAALGTTASGTTISSGATLQLEGGITVGAEALTISGTGAAGQNGALVNVSGTNNYGGLLTLGAATTVSSDSGILNLTNTGTITGAFGLTLTGSGSGSISSIIGTGTGSLTKNGSGTWTLTGTNTYTGGTTVNAGTLIANSGNTSTGTFGSGNVTVNSGGTISVGSDNSLVGYGTSGSRTITINAGGVIQNLGSSTNHLNALVMNGGVLSATTANATYGNWNFDFGVSTPGTGNTSTISGGNAALTETGGTVFNIGTSDTLIVSSVLDHVSGVGDTGLIKSGSGTLTLSGANTYTSATTINAGILNIQNATALGTTASGTTVSSGATLQLQGGITVGAEALTITGTGASGQNGALVNVSGTNNYGGLLTLGAATTISSDSGTLNLTNTGTITGAFGLTLTGSGSGSISSIIGIGSGAVTKNGAGTWTLSGVNTYTGPTTVNAGDLSTGTFTLTPTGTVSIASGATYTSTGTLNLTPSTSAAQTFVSGAGTLRLRNSSSTALAPDIYYDPNFGDALHYQVTIGSNIDVGTGSRFINGKSDRNDFERYGGDLVFAGSLTGSANLTFTGTPNTPTGGVWQMAYVLQANNSGFSGGITLTDGANLILENSNALTAANSVTFTPSAGATSGLYLYGRSVTIGALSGTSAGTMNIRNGSLVTDNNATINPNIVRSNSVLTVQQTTNTTFNGAISDGPNDHSTGDSGTYYTLGLTKTGTGTLTLGGTNSYTGITTISAGTLEFAKEVSLYNNTPASWTATKIVVASGATAAFNVGGTGEFTSANIDTLKALGTASGGFKSGSFLGLDTTNAVGGSFTYSSVIANTNSGTNVLGLTKLGTGTLVLNAANTYTGLTTVTAGTLLEGVSNSISTGALTVNGATAVFDLGANHTDSVGTVTLDGGGAINGTGTSALTSAGTFEMKSGTVSAILAGSGIALNKTTTGTVTLSGVNTYTGATTVNAGTLNVTGSLASGSAVTVNNSGSVLEGTGTIFGSVSIASSGAILEAGTGSTGQTLTMRGAVTMGSGSIIALSLGASGAHSTLAIGTGGSISFQSLQQFNIIDLGVNSGSTYNGLITGIGADPGTESGWTITNQSWAYHFSYDSASGGEIDLSVTALPEPSTYVAGILALLVVCYSQRARFARLLISDV